MVLAHGTNELLLEIKASLIIKPDKAKLNKNIGFVSLFLFDTV